jgi:hypothetical protein
MRLCIKLMAGVTLALVMEDPRRDSIVIGPSVLEPQAGAKNKFYSMYLMYR